MSLLKKKTTLLKNKYILLRRFTILEIKIYIKSSLPIRFLILRNTINEHYTIRNINSVILINVVTIIIIPIRSNNENTF